MHAFPLVLLSASTSVGLADTPRVVGQSFMGRVAAERHLGAQCNHYRGDVGDIAPFAFFRQLSNGSREAVAAVADPSSGLCVYPGASCGELSRDPDKVTSGEPFKCCALTEGYDKALWGMTPQTVNQIANYGVIFITQAVHSRFCLTPEQRKSENIQCNARTCVMGVAIVAAIAVQVVTSITIAMMTQQSLDVSSRNAMQIASAFLEPVREIFQFLEDIVTVKINYAIGAGDVPLARQVLALGVFGGFAIGAVAAALITALLFIPGVVEAILAPFSFNAIEDGCSLVPTAAEVVAAARPYVLWRLWAWPFMFANMSLAGFLLGVGEYALFGLLLLAEQLLQLVGMYVLFAPNPSLAVLGELAFAGASSATVLMTCILYSRRHIREAYMPLPSFWKRADVAPPGTPTAVISLDDASERDPADQTQHVRSNSSVIARAVSWQDLAREGLLAMSVDLAVQVPIAIGIYLASIRMGIGAMYQISTLQAGFPLYGVSWVVGLVFAMKIRGSTFLGQRNFVAFGKLFSYAVLYTSLLAISSIATTLPFAKPISFDLASQACRYASTPSCLKVYASIFGGGVGDGFAFPSTLQGSSFDVFIPALIGLQFYGTFKAGLYACQDFAYMAKASGWIVVCVFGPAIVAAELLDSTTAVFAAMYLPGFVLAIVFAFRTRDNIRRMFAGESGPWSVDSSSESDSEHKDSDESESEVDDDDELVRAG